MNRTTRAAAVLCAALVGAGLLASSASALTVSPTGTYTVTSHQTAFKITVNGAETRCPAVVADWTVGADGSGTIPAGSFTSGNCTNTVWGNTAVAQTAAWGVNVVESTAPFGAKLVVTIPSDGLAFTPAALPECALEVGGTITTLATFAAFPASVTSFAPRTSALRITTGGTGLCTGLTGAGMQVTSSPTLTLGSAMTISG